MTMTTNLPDGVQLDEHGFYRMVISGEQILGEDEYGPYVDVAEVKRYCRFPAAGADDKTVEDLKRQCHADGLDFLHPVWGWLRNGVKPETEHPENVGVFLKPTATKRIRQGAPVAAATSKGPKT